MEKVIQIVYSTFYQRNTAISYREKIIVTAVTLIFLLAIIIPILYSFSIWNINWELNSGLSPEKVQIVAVSWVWFSIVHNTKPMFCAVFEYTTFKGIKYRQCYCDLFVI